MLFVSVWGKEVVDAVNLDTIREGFGSVWVMIEAIEFIEGLLKCDQSLLLGSLCFLFGSYLFIANDLSSNLFHLLFFGFDLLHSWLKSNVIVVKTDVSNTVI